MILIESLKTLKRTSNKSVSWLYGVLLIVYLMAIGVRFMDPIQSMAMKKFHLGVLPFGQWAVCQFLPSMYNFKNEIVISSRLLPGEFSQPLTNDAAKFSVNHYPMRIIYFSNVRESLYRYLPVYVYLRNVYRGREIVSSYLIEINQNGAYPILLNTDERNQR